MKYTYRTKGTCSTQIDLELEGNVVHNVHYTGGCDGNLKSVAKLVEGMKAEDVIAKLEGVTCGWKGPSCGDQLARALRQALSEEKK